MKIYMLEGIGDHEAVRTVIEKMDAGDYITYHEFDTASDTLLETSREILGMVREAIETETGNPDNVDKVLDMNADDLAFLEDLVKYCRCWQYEVEQGNVPFMG